MKYFNGTNWIECEIYRYGPNGWEQVEVRRYDGVTWEQC